MSESRTRHRLNSILGSLFFAAGAVLCFLVFVDRWTDFHLNFAGIWYQTRNFHVLSCVILFSLGWWSHRLAGVVHDGHSPVFRSVTVYSKDGCELCDRAMELLAEFAADLPVVKVVDIAGHPELERQHAESVPVVEIDGRVRFRGIVSEELLQRLIAARRRQMSAVDQASEADS